MSKYKPGGRAHDALDCISRGGVNKGDVRRALGIPSAKQIKAYELIEKLRSDGLVTRRGDGFHLTRLGEDVRAGLTSGHAVPVEFGAIPMEHA